MPNSYYNFTPAFVPGTKVRSDAVNTQYAALETAFDLLPSDVDALTTGTATFAPESGAGNAYVVTMPNTRTSEQDGDEIVFFASHANTGAATIDVDSLGAKAIVNHEGSALIADDILYFKVDDSNRGDYERAGMEAFRPFEHKKMTMQYYEVPIEVLENREKLRQWANKSLAIAVRKKNKRK